MCRPATCRSCNKITYAGCGQHVNDVMRSVPKDMRCSCNSGKPAKRSLFRRSAAR